MDNNITNSILEELNENNLPKHIVKNLSYHRRHFHLTHEQTIGKMQYTVVSVLPLPYDDIDVETASAKFAYLVGGEKVNKKLSGLSYSFGVYLGCGNMYPRPTLNRFDL